MPAAALAFLTGCGHLAKSPAAPSREALEQRATNVFAFATLLKPAGEFSADPAFLLAPLILHEAAGSNAGPAAIDPGSFNTPGSTLYTEMGTVAVGGRELPQYSYVWFYGVAPGKKPGGNVRAQGVRITLDKSGQPAIWEVLRDSSGLRLLYVSAALEARAKSQFGDPLPGRSFSIERAEAEAPRAVVVRLLEDAGVVMGPIIYVTNTKERDVSAVICRCMPSQAGQLLDTGTYALLPDLLAREVLPPAQWPSFSVKQPSATRDTLADLLRLPDDF